MLNGETVILDTVLIITFAALSLSLVAGMIRLLIGPSLPDRVVALDLIAYIVIAFIATYCIHTGTSDFIDAAIVVALIAFLGTTAFARYVLKAGRPSTNDEI
ncbi:multicomponent Na+:H+ antiporter subunit F [Cyclonatronum proteinivorum]|uniref:Multicomponent Na+:H+ antiporter subunit F n=2 Tax=Cyclonatronum TaxID=2489367 RepID=A0A345UHE8_9BACT|nr:multicomponent Na+:H+ antiporter subunit F [Cyclonatronum proteinivorum]